MFQKDYILRMIEQFVKIIARILHLKEEKQYPQALQEIGEAYRLLFGLTPEMIELMSEADLLQFLRSKGDMDAEKYVALATLLKEEAEILNLQNQDSAKKSSKSFHLFLEAFQSYHQAQEYDRAENLLFDLIGAYPSMKEYGFRFYEDLLQKSDEELIEGGLPRAEVEEGLADLRLTTKTQRQ